jgi:hypothetical protein
MKNSVSGRRGLATIVTTMIILVATVVLGAGVVTWSYSSFKASTSVSTELYSSDINALNEKLVIENVWFGGTPVGASSITFGSSSSATTASQTLTFSLTVSNNLNRMLVVTASSKATGGGGPSSTCRASTVTYSGQALTKSAGYDLNDSNTYQCASSWYLINPPVGTANVVITLAGSAIENIGGAISLYNVAQQGPEATATNYLTGNPASITTNISTLTNNAWIIDSAGSGKSGAFTAGAGQTQRYTLNGAAGSSAHTASTKLVAVAGLTSMTETQAANRLVHVLAAFAPYNPNSLTAKYLNMTLFNAGSVGVTFNDIKINNSTNTLDVPINNQKIVPKNINSTIISYNWSNNIPLNITVSTVRGTVITTSLSP